MHSSSVQVADLRHEQANGLFPKFYPDSNQSTHYKLVHVAEVVPTIPEHYLVEGAMMDTVLPKNWFSHVKAQKQSSAILWDLVTTCKA